MLSGAEEAVFDEIDALITSKENGRGIKDLYAAVREISISPMCLSAAKDILGVKGSVFIVTGFPVVLDDGSVVGETDGALGTARLVYGLSILGKYCYVITDQVYSKPISDLLNAIGVISNISVIKKREKVKKELSRLLKDYRPDAIIAIELPGRGYDNRYRDMNGRDITPYVVPLDQIIDIAKGEDIRTIGIGDGGNEAGMGWIMDAVKRVVKNGEAIASKVKTDQLVVGSTSNWGAYGLLAALGNLANKPLLCNSDTEERLFTAASGLVDGKLKVKAPSVDGFSKEESTEMIKKLIALIHYDELACED
jgi:hypothetical protein